MKKGNDWARLQAYVTGSVNHQLLLQNEYLAAENRILRAHLPSRLRPSDPERSTLAEIGKRLAQGAERRRLCGKARHDSGMVSPPHSQQVRRIKIPFLPSRTGRRSRTAWQLALK